jgi:hypothetical protein
VDASVPGALAALAVLLYSLGRAKGRIKEKSASRPPVCWVRRCRSREAGVQGAGALGPVRLTEEDVLSSWTTWRSTI